MNKLLVISHLYTCYAYCIHLRDSDSLMDDKSTAEYSI